MDSTTTENTTLFYLPRAAIFNSLYSRSRPHTVQCGAGALRRWYSILIRRGVILRTFYGILRWHKSAIVNSVNSDIKRICDVSITLATKKVNAREICKQAWLFFRSLADHESVLVAD